MVPETPASVDHDPAEAVRALAPLLSRGPFAVLTGAGVSTDSGIPDYRSPGRPARTPIQHRQFVESEAWRRRYWARSLVGWPRFSAARPNATHAALAALEGAGWLTGLVTQNVDGLHQAAGSRDVVELHGALGRVRCLGCGAIGARDALQERLAARNPDLDPRAFEARPDGDAELDDPAIARVEVVACERCEGVLMPDVVFFGGSVPKATVDAAMARIDAARALLVLGTSLAVFSGYRFVRRARERGVPIVIVNRGPTRGDPDATLKFEAPLGVVVPALAGTLLGTVPHPG